MLGPRRGCLLLFEQFGLTLEDARTNDNYPLVKAAHRDYIRIVSYLIETVGLTLDVAHDNYKAIRVAYAAGSERVVLRTELG